MEQEARDLLTKELVKPARRKIDVEKVMSLGVRPSKPFDLKAVSDAMWDESLS